MLSAYGEGEFPFKQLERDFGNPDYAIVRSFVIKLEELGLHRAQKYGNRVKHRVP